MHLTLRAWESKRSLLKVHTLLSNSTLDHREPPHTVNAASNMISSKEPRIREVNCEQAAQLLLQHAGLLMRLNKFANSRELLGPGTYSAKDDV